MPTTRVTVLQSNGWVCVGASVRLSFVDLAAGGVTQTVLTDADGVAVIEHRSDGIADIIVNGRRWGRFVLPNDVTIEVG